MLLCLLRRLEQNPAVMPTSEKNIQKRLQSDRQFPFCSLLHLVQDRRKSGRCQWDQCLVFGGGSGCDLIPHKNHIFSLNSLNVCGSWAEWLQLLHPSERSNTHLGDQQGFYVLGMSTRYPTPIHLLCISSGECQFLYNTEEHCILITFSIWFWPYLRVRMHFQTCWWTFPPRPQSPFYGSFPKPQQEPLHHLLFSPEQPQGPQPALSLLTDVCETLVIFLHLRLPDGIQFK